MEEAFNWIRANICRSHTTFHMEGCKVLIDLFADKFKDEPFCPEATNELMEDLINKETFLIVEV